MHSLEERGLGGSNGGLAYVELRLDIWQHFIFLKLSK